MTHPSFFYALKLKKANVNENGYARDYEIFMKSRYYYIFTILVVINIASVVMLTVPLVILNIYISVVILIISLIFKTIN